MGGLCGGKTQVTLSIPYHPERLKSTRRYYQEITCIEDLKTVCLGKDVSIKVYFTQLCTWSVNAFAYKKNVLKHLSCINTTYT